MCRECSSKHSIRVPLGRGPPSLFSSISSACLLIIVKEKNVWKPHQEWQSPLSAVQFGISFLFKRTTGKYPTQFPPRAAHIICLSSFFGDYRQSFNHAGCELSLSLWNVWQAEKDILDGELAGAASNLRVPDMKYLLCTGLDEKGSKPVNCNYRAFVKKLQRN